MRKGAPNAAVSAGDALLARLLRACRAGNAKEEDETFRPGYVPEPPSVFGRGYLFGTGLAGCESWPSRFTNSDIEMLHQVTSRPGELYRLLTFSNEGARNHQNTSIAELGQRNARAADDLRRIRGEPPDRRLAG